uniref:Uncharacterized protein n=1 Tax=Anguilla anguilla TaxID=7936 RepID=A0A0E9VC94_ANGAN
MTIHQHYRAKLGPNLRSLLCYPCCWLPTQSGGVNRQTSEYGKNDIASYLSPPVQQ